MKNITLILFLTSIPFFSLGQKKNMLNYMNETAATFENCENSSDKVGCMENGIGDIVLKFLNNKNKVGKIIKSTVSVMLSLRIDPNTESTVWELKTNILDLENDLNKELTNLPITFPPFSIEKRTPVSASYGFKYSFKFDKTIKSFKILENQNKIDLSAYPYPPSENLVNVIHPNCKNQENSNYKDCFSINLIKHIRSNLDEKFVKKNIGLKGFATITFDKFGKTKIVDIKSENPEFKTRIKDALKNLPEMEPATLNGKATEITYTFPIKI
ncbi:hypothetical protein [Mariniflexile sp.]|uniref:hypothetical protein n=1 Tax=Mariniflexile sp. TaxID=1979402 RepID=UPI004048B56D